MTRGTAEGPTSWAHAASRLRRLHLGQLLGFAVFGAVVVAVVALSAVGSLDGQHERARLYEGLVAIATASDDLRAIEADFLARGETARPQAVREAVEGLLAGQAAFAAVAERQGADYPASEAMRRHGARSVELLDRVVAVALRNAGGLTDPAAARALRDRVEPLATRLDAEAAAWLAAIDAEGRRSTQRADEDQRRFVAVVAAAVALLALGSLALWWALGRSRDRVVSALRATTDEQLSLSRVATSVPSAESVERVCATAARELAGWPGARTAVIARLEPDRTLSAAGHAGPDPEAAIAGRVIAALRSGAAPAFVEPAGRVAGAPARAVAPIVRHGALWGAAVLSWEADAGAGDEHLARLGRMADMVALAVESVESRERLVAQASTDPLTGLANHRAFQERLAEEVERARRHNRRLALALFDLDEFKHVNDGLGHQAGDRVLAEVAARLASMARSGEMVARVGGEEFAWIMPETDAAGAFAAAERARQEVRRAPVGPVAEMTISGGVCDLRDAADPAGLVRLADGALYWAKSHGRDLVCRYTPEVVRDPLDDDPVGRVSQLRAYSALRALAHAVDARDPSTQRHSERVAQLSHRLALALGWGPARAGALRDAALVHDVGKVGVPDSVLFKPGQLTAHERTIVEAHAALGAQIVSEVLDEEQIGWVRHHHERIDGDGYPDRLAGEDIPMGARIMAVADTWDALTADRPYRRGLAPERAMAIVREVAGAQLDPDVAHMLDEVLADAPLAGSLDDPLAGAGPARP
ncbi:diguanylate cyclase [Miltoncostaea marina]|uniref:diguanylate cyclase n=1 Tax=Miltoncostaea marina TaxID=2843215 RepID=UPI001C3E16D6|nr:diguanylate cyclase [Miltoncostaea marina]